ncbi:MAG: ATP-binding protein [Phycisphaerales bacterium]|nr:ATP-binding protein [Phycisphaerales bacterium]
MVAPASGGAPSSSPHPAISHEELTALLAAFNDATGRLTSTHERLQGEVTKLRSQLADAKVQVERSKHLALLGEMAAGIAHEVRNPLGSILLYARMLQQDLTDRPAQRGIADKIATSVQRLESVVGDVLAFSREMRVRAHPLHARELLESALHAARCDTPEWSAVEARVEAPESLIVHGDGSLLTQVLINIIRNAVEASAGGRTFGRAPTLVLTAGAVTVRTPEGTAVPMHALRVHDSGPGIDPETAEKLFTPFFTTRAAGTGLGLAIVHRIVDAHGGRVSLRTRGLPEKPEGATAEVLLPVTLT